jgi:choline dehydrogenase
MGSANEKITPLGSRAGVKGVSRLRFVDASSFPTLPPGHPTSTVYKFHLPASSSSKTDDLEPDALAEKIAADIIG